MAKPDLGGVEGLDPGFEVLPLSPFLGEATPWGAGGLRVGFPVGGLEVDLEDVFEGFFSSLRGSTGGTSGSGMFGRVIRGSLVEEPEEVVPTRAAVIDVLEVVVVVVVVDDDEDDDEDVGFVEVLLRFLYSVRDTYRYL